METRENRNVNVVSKVGSIVVSLLLQSVEKKNTKDEFDFWLLTAIVSCRLACAVASCDTSMLESMSSKFQAGNHT